MAKVKEDISRVRLIVDGKQGINELGKLEMQAKELATDIKNAKKGTDEYISANARLKDVRSQITGLRKELGITGMTLGQLTRYQSELKKEMRQTTTAGTADYKRLRAELDKVNSAVRTQRAELNGTKGFIGGMGQQLKGFGVMALGAFGITAGLAGLQAVIRPLISKNAELSDALADVQKTTNLTDLELERLTNNLKSFDTRTPRLELLGLSEIAGRLGIKGVKDIEGFVRAADMINVSLGDALGDPEEVMRELGKLTETFGVKDVFGIEDSLLKVGSAINELGMASTANEGYMVEFAKRMGGIAPLAKISIQNILGMGATLDSLGQTSEVSSTALSKLFMSMAKNADVYAKYAKMEVSDFVKLLNEDANKAFIATLKGVKDNSAGITELAGTMGDLGENGGRVIGVIGTLANNWETLEKQQAIANEAFKEGTSIMEEFSTKNENFAANLQKVQNWMSQTFANSTIMNGLDSIVSKMADWVKIPLSETIEAERIQLQLLHSKIISTNIDTEERKKLINELKAAYPDYLGKIDADTVSNEGLSGAIRMVNEQLKNKIILQTQDEEIMEQSERAAEQQIKVFQKEDELLKNVIALAEKHNLTIKEGLSIQDQANDIIAQAEQHYTGLGNTMLAGAFNPVEKLRIGVRQLAHNYEVLNGMEEDHNGLLDEKNKLMNRLGMVPNANGAATGGNSDAAAAEAARVAAEAEAKRLAVVEAKNAEERKEKANEEYKKLVEEFKKHQQEITDLEEAQRIGLLDRDSQDIAKVEAKYADLLSKAKEYHDKKIISDETFAQMETSILDLQNQERDALIKAHSDKIKEERQKVITDISTLQLSAEEQELAKVRSHYDHLIEEARKYGLQTVELEKARDAALDQVKTDRNAKEQEEITKGYDDLINLARQNQMPVLDIERAKQRALLDLASGYGAERLAKEIEIAQKSLQTDITIAKAKEDIQRSLSTTIGHAIDFIGNKSGELTTFQKGLTLAQIALDTASALGKIVPLAVEASTGTGPAAPFVFAGYLASMGAAVFGAIAKARQALSSSSVPKWQSSGSEDGERTGASGRESVPTSAPVQSYYQGGETSDKGIGIGDRYGEFAGFVHKDEYVVPSFIRSHPYVADVIPAIEAIRKDKIRGFYKGGETTKAPKSKGTAVPKSDPEMISLMKILIDKMDAMPTRIKAYMVDSELEEFREKRDMLKKKYVK